MKKLKEFWEKVEAFARKAWKFLKKWGFQVINFFALVLACVVLDWGTFVGGFVSFWAFLLLAYYLFWKALGAEHLFEKKDEPPILPI